MNREQRIKKLEEKVDEMISNLGKTVAKAVQDELQLAESQRQFTEAVKANEAKEMWLKIERRKLDLMAFGRGVKLSPPQLIINCPYDGHCCNQFGTGCLVCEKHNPSVFKKGDWIRRRKDEGTNEYMFQFSHIEEEADRLLAIGQIPHTGGSVITNLEHCEKWKPRYGEKIITWAVDKKSAVIMIHEATRPPFRNIIPFISIEQYDKIIKGE